MFILIILFLALPQPVFLKRTIQFYFNVPCGFTYLTVLLLQCQFPLCDSLAVGGSTCTLWLLIRDESSLMSRVIRIPSGIVGCHSGTIGGVNHYQIGVRVQGWTRSRHGQSTQLSEKTTLTVTHVLVTTKDMCTRQGIQVLVRELEF